VRLLRNLKQAPAAGSADSRQLKGVTEYAVTTVKSVSFCQYRHAPIFEKAPGTAGGKTVI
jgi:hypothetical protein